MKKMNQRVTAMIMSTVLVLALAGCGAETEGDANASENQNAVPRVEVADSAEVLNKVWDTYGDEEKFFVMGGDFDNPVENAAGIINKSRRYTNEIKKVLPIKGGFFLQISHLYMVKVQDNEHA